MATPVPLERLSLRKAEHCYIIGGTQVGKTILEEAFIVDYYNRYANGRILVLDTKPRFRAEFKADGFRAKKLYRRWDHGPTVPGSIVVHDPIDLKYAWQTGCRIVIAQVQEGRWDMQGRKNIENLISMSQQFYDDARASRPQLQVVDEGHDFFSTNAARLGGSDVIERTSRNGLERGLAQLICSQRAKGVPGTIMEQTGKLALFRVDYKADLTRLLEMGVPRAMIDAMPVQRFRFNWWTKLSYTKWYGPYRLALPTRT